MAQILQSDIVSYKITKKNLDANVSTLTKEIGNHHKKIETLGNQSFWGFTWLTPTPYVL